MEKNNIKGVFNEWKQSHNDTVAEIMGNVTKTDNMRRTLNLFLFIVTPILLILAIIMIVMKSYFRGTFMLIVFGLLGFQAWRMRKTYNTIDKFSKLVKGVGDELKGGNVGDGEKQNNRVPESPMQSADTSPDKGQDSGILP